MIFGLEFASEIAITCGLIIFIISIIMACFDRNKKDGENTLVRK